MVAVYLSPIYIIANIYILVWLLKWTRACKKELRNKWFSGAVIITYVFLATAMLIAFFLPEGNMQRFMKLIANYWLGVSLYMFLTVIIVDIARHILRHIKKINQGKLRSRTTFVVVGIICNIVIFGVAIGGAINARIIHETDYNIGVEKDGGNLKELKVVLVADLHLGYNIGCSHMKQMVKKINEQNADVVVIAGDIFDNEYGALDNPVELVKILRGIKTKYGTYATYGNHDIEEPILSGFTFASKGKKQSNIKMDQLLQNANIKLLRDEYVLIDDSVYIYGRPDAERPGRGIDKRKTPKEITEQLDKAKPIITVDHEPSQLHELAAAGVDVDLCGHTHDGQLFPANITTSFMWENSYGYLQVDKMQNIVTSGVGLFGPNMRVATIAEICPITIKFQ